MAKRPDLEADTTALRSFLGEFYKYTPEGDKSFKYRDSLTKIAHREQIQLEIELDDISEYDENLAKNIQNNTHRYQTIIEDLADEILPQLREKDVAYRDNLDVYIRSRILLRQQREEQNPAEVRDPSNMYRVVFLKCRILW